MPKTRKQKEKVVEELIDKLSRIIEHSKNYDDLKKRLNSMDFIKETLEITNE